MKPQNAAILRHSLVAVFALAALAQAGPSLSVHDVKGRALEIELISANAKTVNFRRKDNSKEFTVALDQFDAESQAEIRKQAAALPPVLPVIEADVVVGKRRDKGQSYYMMKQEISCTVKLHNVSQDIELPKLTGKVIFIGRNTRNPDDYTVLSAQEFPVELKIGGDSSTELKPFVTEYDSDNKGVGNVGGYQYSGYLLVFINDKKEVVFDQTTDADIRKAVTGKPKLLAAMAKYTKGAYLDNKMTLQDQKLRPPSFNQ